MEMLNFILAGTIEPGDFTGFTFFIGSVSMLAATVWFLMQHGQVDKKFKDSMLVAALITGIMMKELDGLQQVKQIMVSIIKKQRLLDIWIDGD